MWTTLRIQKLANGTGQAESAYCLASSFDMGRAMVQRLICGISVIVIIVEGSRVAMSSSESNDPRACPAKTRLAAQFA